MAKIKKNILVVALLIIIVVSGCASNKNARNMKPCDCPELDHKTPKRKKHSSLIYQTDTYYIENHIV